MLKVSYPSSSRPRTHTHTHTQARLAKAEGFGGETIMRFDDTNPEAEKQEYIDSILKNVR
jgi:hypothetical protein